ncbi:MAG: glycosyltransferase [Clostridia bacterium]|nr:glycosyltransferase [Clostridia bacterium]MBQ7095790.1 glycosyltransferase [Clostridia bacterium]
MQRVMIVNCFETYEQRVELLCDYFQENGCEVKVITSDWLHMHKTIRQTCPDHFEMIHVKPYTKNLSPQRLMSHDGFAKAAQRKMEEYQPDLLWVLIPPNSLAKTASAYKAKHPKVKLVMDLIDMWPETMPISRFKNIPPFTNWRKLRDQYLRYADAVVTECNLFQSILHGVCDHQKMHTLYLGRKSTGSVSNPNPPTDRVSLCYLGSINNIIDISCIEQIIRNIKGDVELHIIGDGENRRELIDRASGAGANVIYHGKIYDAEKKQQIMDQCHFGLNIMKQTVFVGLTMKSIDYFEYGLPIINNIQGDTWYFVKSKGVGMNLSDLRMDYIEMIQFSNQSREGVPSFFLEYFTEDAFKKRVNEILETII